MGTEHQFDVTYQGSEHLLGTTWRVHCLRCKCGMSFEADNSTDAEAFRAGYARALSLDDCHPRH